MYYVSLAMLELFLLVLLSLHDSRLLFSSSVMSSSFATPETVTCRLLLSMGFSRQDYWSGLPFTSPGDLPGPGIKPLSPASAGRFFTTELPVLSRYVRSLSWVLDTDL